MSQFRGRMLLRFGFNQLTVTKTPARLKMKKTLTLLALSALGAAFVQAQSPLFTPGNLAVLQICDGGPGRCLPLGANGTTTLITNYSPSDIASARQNQLFIDEYSPTGINQTNNWLHQIAIPTNGSGAMLLNGNAGTEGNLTLSGDKSLLTFTAYQGDILSITTGGQTAPSNLSYDRGIGTVDAFGNYANPYRGSAWYGIASGKTNPRGVATDGAGNFWGCGNGYGSLYYNANTGSQPIQFQNIALTSCSKVINGKVYASVKSSEAVNLYPAGIYSFVDFYNNPVNYPNSASFLHLEIPANASYSTCVGFDINPQNNIAYVADTSKGIQKYVKSGLSWSLAYNLSIPGFTAQNNGIMTNAASTNLLVGCFSVTVDWSGANPVVYATTTDTGSGSAGSTYYGNRVIRINDTNTTTAGVNLIATTNILTTVVRPPTVAGIQLTNVNFKSVTFTPDLRPVITSQPNGWSAVTGDNVNFNIAATSPYSLTYQWLTNGVPVGGATGSQLSLNSVPLAFNGLNSQCVVANTYGAVTSSIAILTVNAAAIPPAIIAQNITNYIGNNVSFTAQVTGSDVKGGYQWYLNGAPLSDANEYTGTATSTLNIQQAQLADAGNYQLSVTNIAGSTNNLAVKLTLVYAPPVFIQPPQALTTFYGGGVTNVVSAYGQALTYQWFTSTNKTTATPSGLKALSNAGDFSGTTTASLAVNPVQTADVTNYVVVVSNPGGSITSSPVALSAVVQPAHTFVLYATNGLIYSQNFNSLPVNGGGSADAANPNSINVVTNSIIATNNLIDPGVAGINTTYSVANPFDFGYPVIAQGGIGGFGLNPTMSGWYGWAANNIAVGATYGDQSAGGIIDNGQNYLGNGVPLNSITNRALGLISTTKTGTTAFGLAIINNTTNTLGYVNLSYTGELWRNNVNQQPLLFGYYVDPAGTSSTFHPDVFDAGTGINYLPNLNVAFATSSSTLIVDGTQTANQASLATNSMTVSGWAPGTTLWLIWQAQTLGGAQAVAIDNVSFSASAAPIGTLVSPLTITPGSTSIIGTGTAARTSFSFTNASGLQYTVLSSTNLLVPTTNWSVLGTATENPIGSGQYQFTDPLPLTNSARFYQLRQP